MGLTGARWRLGRAVKRCHRSHVHDYDEYMIVVLRCYTLIVDQQRIPLNAGDEYLNAR